MRQGCADLIGNIAAKRIVLWVAYKRQYIFHESIGALLGGPRLSSRFGGCDLIAMDSSAILIAGPTASGKSALALRLAEACAGRGGAAIINADSQQVYAELRILTARPSAADEARVPHHLYGHRTVAADYSVATWRREALTTIADVERSGQTPIVVGGTGLYFKTLLEGIAEIPDVPSDVRVAIRRRLKEEGSQTLHQELVNRDPETAVRLNPNDGQRIARALEVFDATGSSLSTWQRKAATGERLIPVAKFVLTPDRSTLHQRIERRFVAMVESGAIEEATSLIARSLDPAHPAMKALGVPELLAHLGGELSLDVAIEQAQTATRRFAKRQMTWFRNQMTDWSRAEGTQQLESIFREIFPFIR